MYRNDWAHAAAAWRNVQGREDPLCDMRPPIFRPTICSLSFKGCCSKTRPPDTIYKKTQKMDMLYILVYGCKGYGIKVAVEAKGGKSWLAFYCTVLVEAAPRAAQELRRGRRGFMQPPRLTPRPRSKVTYDGRTNGQCHFNLELYWGRIYDHRSNWF